jgi:hypothetical protein
MENESQGTRTSLYSILCIAIRLGAVMLAWNTIERLSFLLGQGQLSAFSAEERWIAEVFFGSGILVSFFLWLYPGPLARMASARSAHQIFESPISAADMQWIALSVLGMFWVMSGILDLADLGYRYVWVSEMLGTGAEAARRLHGQIAYDVLETLIGIALTLGARGLAGVLQKVRYVGSSGMPARKSSALEDSD